MSVYSGSIYLDSSFDVTIEMLFRIVDNVSDDSCLMHFNLTFKVDVICKFYHGIRILWLYLQHSLADSIFLNLNFLSLRPFPSRLLK